MAKDKKALTLKNLNKSNVWDMQENDVFRILDMADKDIDLKDNIHSYLETIRSAFEIEEIKIDNPIVIKKYEDRGFSVGLARISRNQKTKVGIKKRQITRITDITTDNIQHIATTKLLEVIDKNFGGGWDSLKEETKNIITRAFDISTTTLPIDRLHNPGGMYDTKVNDGYEVLEIKKGTWVEAIFAKKKPQIEVPATKKNNNLLELDDKQDGETSENNENFTEGNDSDYRYDDNQYEEESYHTTFEAPSEEDLDLEADSVTEEDYE